MLFLLVLVSASGYAQQTAQNLFNHFQSALYQIRLIELGSGNKSSIGSGFQIDSMGTLVTNYHVVSDFVYFPEKYRMEYLSADGSTGDLRLVNFDVINDLAIVTKTEHQAANTSFALAESLPKQGEDIYSLGNPHDLGMIVVPGTFNGLKKNSFYQRIHFTGSINPGMSGGPVVDTLGHVVGVNVATAGNQIGFLIPLNKLQALLASHTTQGLSRQEYKSAIRLQLLDNQQQLFARLSQDVWQSSQLGEAFVPSGIGQFLSCWGDSNSANKEALFLSVENRCRLDEQIYLHNSLRTGGLEIEFEWLSSEHFGQHRFYSFYGDSIAGAGAGNLASKTDVTNYQCKQEKITNQHGVTMKTTFCLRAYREFADLFDVLYIGATLDHQTQGLISHFTLAGVSKDSALKFTQQFMGAISWR